VELEHARPGRVVVAPVVAVAALEDAADRDAALAVDRGAAGRPRQDDAEGLAAVGDRVPEQRDLDHLVRAVARPPGEGARDRGEIDAGGGRAALGAEADRDGALLAHRALDRDEGHRAFEAGEVALVELEHARAAIVVAPTTSPATPT